MGSTNQLVGVLSSIEGLGAVDLLEIQQAVGEKIEEMTALRGTAALGDYWTCTRCAGRGYGPLMFGFRRMPDGTIRSQPQCRKCRAEGKVEAKLRKKAQAQAEAQENREVAVGESLVKPRARRAHGAHERTKGKSKSKVALAPPEPEASSASASAPASERSPVRRVVRGKK